MNNLAEKYNSIDRTIVVIPSVSQYRRKLCARIVLSIRRAGQSLPESVPRFTLSKGVNLKILLPFPLTALSEIHIFFETDKTGELWVTINYKYWLTFSRREILASCVPADWFMHMHLWEKTENTSNLAGISNCIFEWHLKIGFPNMKNYELWLYT